MDGPLLMQLKHMYDTAPNVFYANAREHLGLTHLSDLLRYLLFYIWIKFIQVHAKVGVVEVHTRAGEGIQSLVHE